MTVNELIDRYLQTRTGVKPNTLINYKFVKNLMEKEEFGSKDFGSKDIGCKVVSY